jgi:hypothetical protein
MLSHLLLQVMAERLVYCILHDRVLQTVGLTAFHPDSESRCAAPLISMRGPGPGWDRRLDADLRPGVPGPALIFVDLYAIDFL